MRSMEQTREVRQPTMGQAIDRALRLRCPVCGQGRMFRGMKERDACPHCGFRFEREPGYFTNALIVNYVITCLPIFLIIAPVAFFGGFSVWSLLGVGLLVAIMLPILGFRYSKALWLAVDVVVRPPAPVEFAPDAPDG